MQCGFGTYLSYVSRSEYLECFCNSRENWVTVFVCEPGISLACFEMLGTPDGRFLGAGPWFVLNVGKTGEAVFLE